MEIGESLFLGHWDLYIRYLIWFMRTLEYPPPYAADTEFKYLQPHTKVLYIPLYQLLSFVITSFLQNSQTTTYLLSVSANNYLAMAVQKFSFGWSKAGECSPSKICPFLLRGSGGEGRAPPWCVLKERGEYTGFRLMASGCWVLGRRRMKTWIDVRTCLICGGLCGGSV